jgi:hypothetical protein
MLFQSSFTTGYYLNTNPISSHSIILDVDESLVHSITGPTALSQLKELQIYTNPQYLDIRKRSYFLNSTQPLIGEYTYLWGIKRPYLDEFLRFCFSYFQVVGIWSAGNYVYVPAIVESLFTDYRAPHIVYWMDHCEFDEDDNYYKPLKKLINNEKSKFKLTLAHTFFLDDRKRNFRKNPRNGIEIPPYKPELTIEGLGVEDNCLFQLMNWFLRPEVISAPDIRELDKKCIFENTNKLPRIFNETIKFNNPEKSEKKKVKSPKQKRIYSPELLTKDL